MLNKLLLQLNHQIEFDHQKREQTLRKRGLDFAHACDVFAEAVHTVEDQRKHYGERRFITVGFLNERLTVIVWTPRGVNKRIISMRNAKEREIKEYSQGVG